MNGGRAWRRAHLGCSASSRTEGWCRMPSWGGRSVVVSLERTAVGAGGVGLAFGHRQARALLAAGALACMALLAVALGAPGTRSLTAGPSTHTARSVPAGLAPIASASIGRSEHSYWAIRHGDSLLTEGGGIHTSFAASGAHMRVGAGTLDLS